MSPKRSNYLHLQGSGPIPEGWDGIRIGSEFCSQLVPSIEDLRSISEKRDPGSLSLVTPVAGPDEVADVLRAVTAAVSMGWGEVVVNDWGVLAEAGGTGGIGITAGRLLMRFRRGPGVFDLSEDPGDELDLTTRRYFAWGPLYDSPFLAFLKGKGVDRVELDPPRHWLPLPDLDGLCFSLHQDSRLISVSAACPWLYDEKKGVWRSVKGCGRHCLGKDDIVMKSEMLTEPLLLRGRAILERVELDMDGLNLPDTVDRVICERTP